MTKTVNISSSIIVDTIRSSLFEHSAGVSRNKYTPFVSLTTCSGKQLPFDNPYDPHLHRRGTQVQHWLNTLVITGLLLLFISSGIKAGCAYSGALGQLQGCSYNWHIATISDGLKSLATQW